MKTSSTILAMVLVTSAILWWRLTGRAGGSAPPPDIPLPAGTTVVKRLEPLVNLQATRITVAVTTLRPAEVDRYYRVKLTGLGWQEQPRSALPLTERSPLTFRRGAWEFTAFAFPDLQRRTTNLLLQLRPADAGPRRRRLTRAALAGRLEGFPLFPGVDGALLIEGADHHSPATILFETDAPLDKVADFYRRRLTEGPRPFPGRSAAGDWASGAYHFRRWTVLINLCRRPGGGTSALVILNRMGEGATEAGVEAWSGGATF